MSDCTDQYLNYIVDQLPVYDNDGGLLKDVNPMSGTWLGKMKTKVWSNGNSNSMTFDRMHKVFPNPVREWIPKDYANCEGNPCDVPAEIICTGGYSRNTFYKEIQKHKSRVLCFDSIRDFTHAEEHWAYIVSDILQPAADIITSYYMKKRAATLAGQKFIANSALTPFTFVWVVNGTNETQIWCNAPPGNVFKMAPQMLQKRFTPLIRLGYFNQRVIEVPSKMAEFITDEDTVWSLTRQLNDSATPALALKMQWQYTDFSQASEFWKYGWSGAIGNYAMSTDPFQLRFNYRGLSGDATNPYVYDVLLPYSNIAADVGNKINSNADYDNACFGFSYTHNRAAFCLYGATAQSIHPSMPFVIPDLAGKWRFATTDLGCENYEHNKGLFYARFEYAIKPEYPEWEELWFHRREPPCIPEVGYCNECSYPTQTFGCTDPLCDSGPWTTDEECREGQGVQVTAVTISGIPIALEAATIACAADHAALAVLLNEDDYAKLLGTWDTNDDDLLILTDATVQGVSVTIECCDELQ